MVPKKAMTMVPKNSDCYVIQTKITIEQKQLMTKDLIKMASETEIQLMIMTLDVKDELIDDVYEPMIDYNDGKSQRWL